MNPLDGQTKEDMQRIIKAVVATFTLEYSKAFALGLVAKREAEINAGPSPYVLLERPEDTSDLKAGYLTKEGGIFKNWKKRYFVVRYDYNVDYYAGEADAKKPKAKPKGTMSLGGYSVNSDVNGGLLKRLEKLAEKMGMQIGDLPKPKQYPEHTIELHHYRRRSYYIQFSNEEEKKEWTRQFETICWRAYGLKNWKDKVHVGAFHEAVRKTRWELGRWGWWSYGGSEEQILSDLIATELDYEVMGRIYSKISGPWIIRNKIRNSVLKFLDTTVSAAVSPAWKAMAGAVEQLRPKIEPIINEMTDPLAKAKKDIMDKIKEGVLGVVNPLMDEHVKPHLGKILEIIKSPMVEAFDESYHIFEQEIDDFTKEANLADTSKGYERLNYVPRSYHMWRATDKLDVMYEPLWLLREIFTDIYPWSMIWNAQQDIRNKVDNAMYTFQHKVAKQLETDANAKNDGEASKAIIQKSKEDTLDELKRDGEVRTVELYVEIMKAIVMPPLNATIVPACKMILQPLADLIPEAMKQFIDILAMFDKLIDDLVTAIIENILS
jgi:uncharacterized protein YjgD (DUF1641 family)